MTHHDFAIASGSVTGRNHRNINLHKNGQDGLAVIRTEQATVAVVTDGCGSSKDSEVGAKLGARLVANTVSDHISDFGEVLWDEVLEDVLQTIDSTARLMGGNYRQTIEDYFLFTIVGVALTDETADFFALGDGVFAVNNNIYQLGPFPGNQPPYAAYGLLAGRLEPDMKAPNLEVVASCELEALQSFAIGCDGVMDLIAAEHMSLPGMSEQVGNISQFWDDPNYFDPNKPDLLNRRLRLISRDWPRKDPEPGLLPDDTTLIVGRLAKPEEN